MEHWLGRWMTETKSPPREKTSASHIWRSTTTQSFVHPTKQSSGEMKSLWSHRPTRINVALFVCFFSGYSLRSQFFCACSRGNSIEAVRVTKPARQQQNKLDHSRWENVTLREHFNYCNADFLGDKENEQFGFPVWYQCEGENYDAFGKELHEYAEQKVYPIKNPTWGRREFPIPANKTVLFFGNSHTRQLGGNLACQMGAEEVVDVYHFEFDLIDPNMAIRFRFRNGASVYIVANSYVAYSKQWKELLEKQIQKPLEEFDLVVMGIFNVAKGASTFLDNMQYLASTLPEEYEMDLATEPPGPPPQNITAEYDGPFLLVSNYSINQQKVFELYRRLLRKDPRPDHDFLSQRKYIDRMHAEGAAVARNETKDMTVDALNPRANRLHRCVGKHGGHPDLISWDVTEFLYEHSL